MGKRRGRIICLTGELILNLLAVLHHVQPGNTAMATHGFLAEPQDISARLGSTIQLHCSVQDGEGAVHWVQWVRDGFGLGLDPQLDGYPRYQLVGNQLIGEYTMEIVDVQLEDDAWFECQVGSQTPNAPGLVSRKAKVDVLVPPSSVYIEATMPSASSATATLDLFLDRNNSLNCLAFGGKPSPSITWQVANQNLQAQSIVVEERGGADNDVTKSRMMLVARMREEGSLISCVAQHAALDKPIVASAIIHILFPPNVSLMENWDKWIAEDSSITINCSAQANPTPSRWRWFKNDEELYGEIKSSLNMNYVSRDQHDDVISCQAENIAGSGRASLSLKISYKPFAPRPVIELSESLDNTVILECEMDSRPEPIYRWTVAGSTEVIATTKAISVSLEHESDFGEYTCSAYLDAFPRAEQHFFVFQKGFPKIVAQSIHSAYIGDNVTLECRITASPPLTNITWTKGYQVILQKMSQTLTIHEQSIRGGKLSFLKIFSFNMDDIESYKCIAQNAIGITEQTFHLSKKDFLFSKFTILIASSILLLIIFIVVAVIVCRRNKAACQFREVTSLKDKKQSEQIPDTFLNRSLTNEERNNFQIKSSFKSKNDGSDIDQTLLVNSTIHPLILPWNPCDNFKGQNDDHYGEPYSRQCFQPSNEYGALEVQNSPSLCIIPSQEHCLQRSWYRSPDLTMGTNYCDVKSFNPDCVYSPRYPDLTDYYISNGDVRGLPIRFSRPDFLPHALSCHLISPSPVDSKLATDV